MLRELGVVQVLPSEGLSDERAREERREEESKPVVAEERLHPEAEAVIAQIKPRATMQT